MAKVRLVRTMIVEYELVPEYYPEGSTFEEMSQIDANAEDRELLFQDVISDEVKWEIIK